MERKKVVIVDDDIEFLRELKEALNGDTFEVVVVEDPLSALRVVEEHRPHLVVLDLKMPKKTGFQIAQELQKSGVPVIGMTGYFTEAEHSLLMNMCGIRHCLRKPFSPSEAMEKIEQMFLEEAGFLEEGKKRK
jgi:DNA-binding response OmpR family regulator